MVNNPLVTVGIASYNNREYIEKCVKSVLAQTYANIEILIVDDGSTDNSLEICREINVPNIAIITKENGGLSTVRQTILNNANGEFVCFIDADDYLDETYVNAMLNKMVENELDICVGSTVFMNSDGMILERETAAYSYVDSIAPTKITKKDLIETYYGLLCKYFMCDSWNKMYRKSFILSSGVKFEYKKGLNGSDLAFNHKLMLCCPVIEALSEKVYYHIIYTKSAVHRKNKKLELSVFTFMEQLIDVCNREQILSKMQNQLLLVYMASIRDVFQDCYAEKDNKKECKLEMDRLLHQTKEFASGHGIIIKPVKYTKSLYAFSILYKLSLKKMLIKYFELRRNSIG